VAKSWQTSAVRQILCSGRIAGLREHHGQVIGPAVWPAIITPAERDCVLARIAARSVTKTRAPRYLSEVAHPNSCGRHTSTAPEGALMTTTNNPAKVGTTVSSSAAAWVTPCSSALPSAPAQCSHRLAAIPLYCNRFARRPQRPESYATAGAGARDGWGIVWLAVGESGMVVRLRARTEPTNAPAVEADDATAGGGKHGQGASATCRTTGSGWGCRCFAGHSVCRGRIRCQCTLTRYGSGVRNRVGTQGDGRQDGQANYSHSSRATVSPP
jgi:hypothetical protein